VGALPAPRAGRAPGKGRTMKVLDLGCGPTRKKEGAVGVDIAPAPTVDVVHDLNVFPYPFGDDEFDWIEMSNILEHLDRPMRVMDEVWRIAGRGATVRISTPHYTSWYSYADLTHVQHFGYVTFTWLAERRKFKIKRKKLYFRDIYKVLGVSLLANLFPRQWERYLCFIFPANFVEVFLEVVK